MTVTVVGMGPGSAEYITPVARQAVARADIIIGSDKWLDSIDAGDAEKVSFQPMERLLATLKSYGDRRNIAVLVTGDPGLSSLLGVIKRELPDIEVNVIPGISSAQVAFARLGLDWMNVRLVSLHGRPIEKIDDHLSLGACLLVLTDTKNDPERLGRYLAVRGWRGRAVVGERLTEAGESLTEMRLGELKEFRASGPNVVYIELRGQELRGHNT